MWFSAARSAMEATTEEATTADRLLERSGWAELERIRVSASRLG